MNKKILDKRKCPECGKVMKTPTKISWEDEKLGSFTIECEKGEYHTCSCGFELVSYKLALRIEEAELKVKKFKENKE